MRRTVTILYAFLFLFAVERSNGQILRRPWYESKVDSDRITFSFELAAPASAEFEYLSTAGQLLGSKSFAQPQSSFEFTIEGLAAATQYYCVFHSGHDSVAFITSTSSGSRSSEAIEVYFNRTVDSASFPGLERARGDQDLVSILSDKIADAKRSIDLALYSFSGVIGVEIAHRLIDARDRGVKIRVIADSESVRNSSAFAMLKNSGIPAIINSFGANKDVASNIHHNKFVVIDGRDDDWMASWVMTGSWNLSDQQTRSDYQNVIYVQDLALARAYESEFNEEWGSAGDNPDPKASRFSIHKKDNTPRSFNIGGREAHLFFSPNGGTTAAIGYVLSQATSQILFALFAFTRQDLAQILANISTQGVMVRGIINNQDAAEQAPFLRSAGVDVLNAQYNDTVLLHHKYAIIDPGTPQGTVITGSQNWSTSAEIANNENVLIIQDKQISEQYIQEWIARYHESGGNQSITLPTLTVHKVLKDLLGVYPNPAQSFVTVANAEWKGQLTLIDELGRMLKHSDSDLLGRGTTLDVRDLPRGVYTVILSRPTFKVREKLLVVH